MQDSNRNSDAWTACPPGALQHSARRVRGRRLVRRTLPVAAALMLLLVAAWLSWGQRGDRHAPPAGGGEFHYGGIACSEVVRRLEDLARGRVDADTRTRMEAHLRLCSKCQAWQARVNQEARLPASLSVVPSLVETHLHAAAKPDELFPPRVVAARKTE